MVIPYELDIDPRIEIRHLRYFVAVAEELHFGRAAQRLGIAQPPLSQQIKRLETLMGVSLLERSSRRVALTDAGAALLEESHNVFHAMGKATARAKRAAAGEVGALTVTFADSIMFQGLPGIIRVFRDRYPGVRLELEELSTGAQITALRSGELDVGFVRDPEPDPAFRIETVLKEPLLIAMAATHPMAGPERSGPNPRGEPYPFLDLADLAGEDFVLFPRDVAPGLFDQVMGLCREAGFAPRVVQESRELPTTVSLVEAGMGVTILPASISRVEWAGIAYRGVNESGAHTKIVMVSRLDNERPVVSAFLDVARGLVEATGTSLPPTGP